MGKKVTGENVATGLEARYTIYTKNSTKDKPTFFGKWEKRSETNRLENVKKYIAQHFSIWPFVSQTQKNGELTLVFWDGPRPGSEAARNPDAYIMHFVHVKIVPTFYVPY